MATRTVIMIISAIALTCEHTSADEFSEAFAHRNSVAKFASSPRPLPLEQSEYPKIAAALNKIWSIHPKTADLQWGIWSTHGQWEHFRLLGAYRDVDKKPRLTLLCLEFGPLPDPDRHLLVEGNENNDILEWFRDYLLVVDKGIENQVVFKFAARLQVVSETITPRKEQSGFVRALAHIGATKSKSEIIRDPQMINGKPVPGNHFIVIGRNNNNLVHVAFPFQQSEHLADRVHRGELNPGFYEVLKNAEPAHRLLTIGEEGMVFVDAASVPRQYIVRRFKKGAYLPDGIITSGRFPPRWAKIAGVNPKHGIRSIMISAVAAEDYWRKQRYFADPELWAFSNH